MKTKNIFRMLLVAAALLMGANNVKAGVDGQIWPANGADNTTSQCSIDKQIFINANITAGQYIRVYLGTITGDGGYWQMGFKANGADPEFEEFPGQNWGVQTISSQMNVSISSGYIDLKCSENTVTKLKSGGFTIDANGIILKNVAIVGGSSSGGGSTSTDTPVWTGNQWLNNWNYYTLPSGTFSSLKCDGTDVIRIYGNLGNLGTTTDEGKTILYGIELVADWGDSSKKTKHTGTDNFTAGYYDFTNVSSTLANALKSNGIINGYNFYVTSIVVNPSSTSTKTTPTLTFSPSTATATMGEAFTAPTLTATANGETVTGLSISYSSSNTSVATVNASTGAVTLVAPGTTTITASFSGNDNYNEATASYTLTVNAAAEYIAVDDNNIGENGYRTYVTWCAVDLSRSVNVEAYYATGLNSAGTEVEFTQVTGVCASGVPLLLKATVTGASEYKLLKSSAAGTTPTGNKLVGGAGDNISGANKYVLTSHNGSVVFAEVNIVGARVPTGYAYLDLSGSNARGRLSIRLNGESTGISTIQNDERDLDGIIYNLRGQRVENPTKGLYIINGKKVVIK